ncbi:ribosome biogenesis protein BOP1 homolog [Rhodnius prolixus]|uniref:Ribosome biogenesis protein BOP1 homolog n=2 Tax=Rhodnius TaxID=13248 RepID=T1HDG7_RHOPR
MKRKYLKSSKCDEIISDTVQGEEEPNLFCSINESDSNSEDEREEEEEEEEEEMSSEGEDLSSESEGDLDEDNDSRSDNENGSKEPLDENETVSTNKENEELPDAECKHLNSAPEVDEYEGGDTSDEEDIRNTIGNIPLNWYDDHEHIGYDWEGNKIVKSNQGDQLDYFLKQMEDPDFWRSVKDTQTGQDIVLSDKDIELIRRLGEHKIPDKDFDEYAPWIEWFTSEVMEMPLRKFPEHKRSFVPSRDEMKRVSKYVYALKMGWMKSRRAMRMKRKAEREKGPQFYMLWKSDDAAEEMRRIQNHIPAPKRPLPGHNESYNPPEEYLFNEREKKKWEKERKSLGNKKLHFVPQKYNSLREVPAYKRLARERFLRCLDLYMCPRAVKMRLTIEPEDLLPQLPDPKSLQPFPTTMSMVYKGHRDMVRSIAVDITGQYLASASDDETLRIWEVNTGRCLNIVPLGGIGKCVVWCPSSRITLVAVAADKRVLLINPKVGDSLAQSKTDRLLGQVPSEEVTKITSERVRTAVNWEHVFSGEQYDVGVRIIINHFKEVKQVAFHGAANYFVSILPEGQNRAVIVHQLTCRSSQLPFSKPRGLVQAALFHPSKPRLIVATQRHIRIYDLVKQEMVQKLMSNSKWISSIAIHPGGDNMLVGTYDKKLLWFDLDLSCKPYKSLALHSQAIRGVAYHKRYPLFASTSDDQSVIVSHGMVYSDLLQNPLIVPLKRFSNHEKFNDFSVFDVVFHPYQPWVFTSGADSTIRLYS